jgi:hypothetical protein
LTFRVIARVDVIAMIGTFVNGSICICINWIVIIIFTITEKLWPWLYLTENKMFCKVCMKAGKKNTMRIGCTTFKTEKCM